jgi:hypothetical protein
VTNFLESPSLFHDTASRKRYLNGLVSSVLFQYHTPSSHINKQNNTFSQYFLSNLTMKFILPTLAMAVSLAAAKNCQTGLNYCSFTLMGKGMEQRITLWSTLLSQDRRLPPTDPQGY